MANQVISSTLPTARLLDDQGQLTLPWLYYFRSLQTAGQAFTQQGDLNAPISPTAPIAVRGIPIGTLLQHITDVGKLDSLTNVVTDVNTDHIADATGSPLAGGKAAYTALVTSGPSAGQVLEWNGSAWIPATLAAGVDSLDSITGAVTLVAGSNITITDNSPGAGQITIAAAGSGAVLRGSGSFASITGTGWKTATITVTGAIVGAAVAATVATSYNTDVANVNAMVTAADTVEVYMYWTDPGGTYITPTANVAVFN